MKHMIAIILVVLTMTTALTGCNNTTRNTDKNTSNYNEPYVSPYTGYGTENKNATTGYGAGTPDTGNDGMIDPPTSSYRNGNVIEEFGNDMKDMVDDAGRSIQDAVDGRNNQTGTGMTGGR